jgi:hypothetical protein
MSQIASLLLPKSILRATLPSQFIEIARTDLSTVSAYHRLAKTGGRARSATNVVANMDLAHLVTGICTNASHPDPALNCAGLKLYSHEPLKKPIKKHPGDSRQSDRLGPAHFALEF